MYVNKLLIWTILPNTIELTTSPWSTKVALKFATLTCKDNDSH